MLTVGQTPFDHFGYYAVGADIDHAGNLLPNTVTNTKNEIWTITEFFYQQSSSPNAGRYRLKGINSLYEDDGKSFIQYFTDKLYLGRADVGEYYGNSTIVGLYYIFSALDNSSITEADVGKEIPIWLATTPPPWA